MDASASREDITVTQGDGNTVTITREDASGNAVDISGWTFYFTVKNEKSDSDADAEIQKTVSSHTDAANGKTQFDISPSDTDNLEGAFFYDIQEVDDTGAVSTILEGTFYVRADVTNTT